MVLPFEIQQLLKRYHLKMHSKSEQFKKHCTVLVLHILQTSDYVS